MCGRSCPAGATCSAGACRYGTQSCPTGQYAVGFNSAGTIQCSTLNAIARAAVHARCRVYYGWRDNCGGTCTTAPQAWGYTTQDACGTSGVGTGNTCSTHTLTTGQDVRMFGLNTDNPSSSGDVDQNDRFYYGLHCTTGASNTTTTTGMCPAGSYITSLNVDGSFVCRAAEQDIVSYLRSDCRLDAGWIDSCNGCTTAATRSGFVSHSTCGATAGANNSCTSYSLGGTTVWMYGLNTNGDVDGNDQFRLGFTCDAVPDAPMSASACPASQLATGVNGGTVTCNAAEARADDYVRSSCWAYHGWRDGCTGGCTSAPSKWGRVRTTECQFGVGADNSCGNYTVGGRTVPMFGLNTDGDVDDNDKFYLGLRCY